MAVNRVVGSLPNQLLQLTRLLHLDVSRNEIAGRIPEGIASLSLLKYLQLQHNLING
jgi:Leucine-rich repeat (LRR) protein